MPEILRYGVHAQGYGLAGRVEDEGRSAFPSFDAAEALEFDPVEGEANLVDLLFELRKAAGHGLAEPDQALAFREVDVDLADAIQAPKCLVGTEASSVSGHAVDVENDPRRAADPQGGSLRLCKRPAELGGTACAQKDHRGEELFRGGHLSEQAVVSFQKR